METGTVIVDKPAHKTDQRLGIKPDAPNTDVVEIHPVGNNGLERNQFYEYWRSQVGQRVSFKRNGMNMAASVTLLAS